MFGLGELTRVNLEVLINAERPMPTREIVADHGIARLSENCGAGSKALRPLHHDGSVQQQKAKTGDLIRLPAYR